MKSDFWQTGRFPTFKWIIDNVHFNLLYHNKLPDAERILKKSLLLKTS